MGNKLTALKRFLKHKRVKFFLKATISVVLFVWVILKVDWKTAWGYVSQVSFPLLFLYVAVLVGSMMISAYKWQILTRYKGFRKSFRWHFETYLAGTFVNNFLPSTIGGDAYRAIELGADKDGRHSPGVSTIFFDRLTGIWALALLGCVFSVVQHELVTPHPLWLGIAITMGVLVIGDMALTFDKRGFFAGLGRYFSQPIENLIGEIASFRDERTVKRVFGLAVAFNLIGVGLANYILFHAFGLPVGIFQFLSVIFIINAIAAVPVSVNNIGIKEWAYFVFFGYLGLSTDVAVTVAIVSRFVQMLISFFALPGYLRGRRR